MRFCALCRSGMVWLLAGVGLVAQVAPIPHADELPGQPYTIRNKWIIGGSGDWDYLTLDPTARQLFVTHGTTVQVVDIETGAVLGTIDGFAQAHAVVLDDSGSYGYATDGGSTPIHIRWVMSSGKRVGYALYAGAVHVFDRRSYKVVASILTPASLRALTLDPETGLLFAVGTDLSTLPPPPEPSRHPAFNRRGTPQPRAAEPPPTQTGPCGTTSPNSSERIPESVIAVIDPTKRAELAEIRVCGILGNAQADGAGGLYVTFTTLNMAARIDTPALLQLLPDRNTITPNADESDGREYTYNDVPELDWRALTREGAGHGDETPLRTIPLGDCREPHGLAVDSRQNRLFVGCNNMKLAVLDSASGASIASFTVGPGTDSVVYDATRGLIYSANGGGYGSLTVIRQHLTDSYAVIQTLPTMERARTMAVDPTTGLLYLATTINGAKISRPPRTGVPGRVKYGPLDGSFQVLVVGN